MMDCIYREDLPNSVNIYMEKNIETGTRVILVNKNLPEEVQEQLIKEGLTEYQKRYGEKF